MTPRFSSRYNAEDVLVATGEGLDVIEVSSKFHYFFLEL
jgi:hypothetical protein